MKQSRHLRTVSLGVATVCCLGSTAWGDSTLQEVVVLGHYENGVGSSNAASAGAITSALIEARPELRPGEVLEFVPGVIVTQHSGDGKANQYFLRGFNLDHGTDFATSLDGVPINMRSHAHGQGYSDLNCLIPELVERIEYKKGPYYAEEGDFASAGAAHIQLTDKLAKGVAAFTGGENSYTRALLVDSVAVAQGQLLYGIELGYNNGPWDSAEHFNKKNGLVRYSGGDETNGYSVMAMGYSARWNATDQIPQRGVESGFIDRFGALDSSDGGETARYSLSLNLRRQWAGGRFDSTLYAVQSRLTLFSNFTYVLDDPVNGDQIEQTEHRKLYGLNVSQTWNSKWHDKVAITKVGLQVRYDYLDPVGLYHTVARERLETISSSDVKESSAGAYIESAVQWTTAFRSVIGARFDQYRFNVDSNLPENSGTASDHMVSPKVSFILRPWTHTEFFANYGQGFHSNDARGTTQTITPRDGLPSEAVTPLVKTRGEEFGLRTEIVDGLQSSVALWRLDVDSELVFSGDAGDTEPSRPSHRYGIELNNHYIAKAWLLFDLDIALSHSRYSDYDPVGDYIPDGIEQVASFGTTITNIGKWFGEFQLRYFGSRPLIEDNSVRSKSTTLAYLDVGYALSGNTKLQLDVFNLFNRAASDIDYFYPSRLQGEPADGVDDIHFHPVEPRTIRLRLTYNF